MSSVEIVVSGHHVHHEPPERGTAHLTVGLEGASAEEVYAGTARSAERVRELVAPLHDQAAGPVTWWSNSQVRTSSYRPHHAEGKKRPVVHRAHTRFQVKFADFNRLSAFVADLAAVPGVHVERIEWALTQRRREAVVGEVRTTAVHDAVQRAQAYADALGLGRVRPVTVADAGMLGDGAGATQTMAMASTRAGGGHDVVELVPEDIEVSAHVDARFAADPV